MLFILSEYAIVIDLKLFVAIVTRRLSLETGSWLVRLNVNQLLCDIFALYIHIAVSVQRQSSG